MKQQTPAPVHALRITAELSPCLSKGHQHRLLHGQKGYSNLGIPDCIDCLIKCRRAFFTAVITAIVVFTNVKVAMVIIGMVLYRVAVLPFMLANTTARKTALKAISRMPIAAAVFCHFADLLSCRSSQPQIPLPKAEYSK